MDKDALQSYFKSLCVSFYIAYKQVKRLEKEEDELQEREPYSELEMVNNLLKLMEQNDYGKKYIKPNFSEEGLRKRKKELEQVFEEYEEKAKKIESKKEKWMLNYKAASEALHVAIKTIKNNNCSIIVTSEKEIIALMFFFREKGVENYRIINTDEDSLKLFPSGKEMYREFYKAYYFCENDKMEEVIREYY